MSHISRWDLLSPEMWRTASHNDPLYLFRQCSRSRLQRQVRPVLMGFHVSNSNQCNHRRHNNNNNNRNALAPSSACLLIAHCIWTVLLTQREKARILERKKATYASSK